MHTVVLATRVVNEPSKVTWWTLPLIPLRKLFHYPILNSRNEKRATSAPHASLRPYSVSCLHPSRKGRNRGLIAESRTARLPATMTGSNPLRFVLATLSRSRARAHASSSAVPSFDTPAAGVRWYRGDSGEAETKLSGKEKKLLTVAQPRYEAIYEKHIRLPSLDDIPDHSLGSDSREEALANKEEIELNVRRKRLVYRAKQRGWLEVDLLLGTWASKNVLKLEADGLDQFEAFVNLETIDIYNVITLRSDVPENMKRKGGDGVVEQIQEWARSSPLGRAEPEKYAAAKGAHNLI